MTQPNADREDPKLLRGHVAIFDVLGWKGIWNRHSIADVLEAVGVVRRASKGIESVAVQLFPPLSQDAMSSFVAQAASAAGEYSEEVRAQYEEAAQRLREGHAADAFLRTDTRFLSDTVVVASWTPPVWGDRMAEALEPMHRLWLSMTIAGIVQECATAPVPLIYRGAVASGQFLIDDNVILGQAVDDAASLMNEADAAIVWFGPPGFAELPTFTLPYYLDYAIPMKDGRLLRAQAVNPFVGCMDPARVQSVYDGFVRAFGASTTIDVVIKKQNTMKFLKAALEAWVQYLRSPEMFAFRKDL